MARAVLVVLLAVASLVGAAAGAVPAGPAVAWAHPEPGDVDGDEVRDEQDNCPNTPNGSQANTDGLADGGDACDADDDQDGVADAADNCRVVANPDQANADGDAYGDACPPVDSDGDGRVDPDDNCDFDANPDQRDLDGDDKGDACDRDRDGDRYDNGFDTCPDVYDPEQADADRDGLGTLCDPDERTPTSGPGAGTGTTPTTGASGPAPGGPGGAPGAGGGAATSDRTAPVVRLSAARRAARDDVRDALPVGVRCSEACVLEARFELSAAQARRAGLRRRTTRLAAGEWALGGAGRTFVVCDWTTAGRRVLRARKAVTGTFVLVARDVVGNARAVRRTMTLR